MKDAINTLREQIANVRENIENSLLAMMRQHNMENVCCGGCSDDPPVMSGDTDIVILDDIELCNINGNEYILFHGCGEYENYHITLKDMDIECLITVYEWVLENQEELFDESDD